MTEEPYRWLEAVANRREYVKDQLKGGSPVFAVSLNAGILFFGVGTGQSKIFEIFDRHAMGAIGHPADIEKMRQAAIDVAHMEAFTRAADDVTLKRLVSFALSPQLKNQFEQIFSAPILVEILLAELGRAPSEDLLVRLHFDGSFELKRGGISVITLDPQTERNACDWLSSQVNAATPIQEAIKRCRDAWTILKLGKNFQEIPGPEILEQSWKKESVDREMELGFLDRNTTKPSRFRSLEAGVEK